MIPALVTLAVRHRWFVLVLAALTGALGVWSFLATADRRLSRHLRADGAGHHDLSRAGRRRKSSGRSPIPIEIAMRNVPKVEVIRSRTIFGLSVVQMNFEEGTEGYWARQRVHGEADRRSTCRDGAKPDLGPLATAYGEIYRYELRLRRHARPDGAARRSTTGWSIPRLLRVARRRRRVELRRPVASSSPSRSSPPSSSATGSTLERRHRRHQEQQRRGRRQRAARAAACRSSSAASGALRERPPDREHLRQVDRRHADLPARRRQRRARLPAARRHLQQGHDRTTSSRASC